MKQREEGDEHMKVLDKQKQRDTGCGMGEAGRKVALLKGSGRSLKNMEEQAGVRSLCEQGIPGVGSHQLGLQQSKVHTDLSKTQRQILTLERSLAAGRSLRVL